MELTVFREQAGKAVVSQINKGRKLRLILSIGEGIHSQHHSYQQVFPEFIAWNEFNELLLKKLFNAPEVLEKYKKTNVSIGKSGRFEDARIDLLESLKMKLVFLESIYEQLPLFKELCQSSSNGGEHPPMATGKKVFVVHGRDEAIKQAVARFLEKLGLEPIILQEQPSKGSSTIIEKIEDYSSVAYAIVLLTPDDVGRLAAESNELSPRARQNVILELGYFIGKLGRKKVCLLHKEGLELPGDVIGVSYIPFDKAGAWKLKLAKELKAASVNIDFSKVVGA